MTESWHTFGTQAEAEAEQLRLERQWLDDACLSYEVGLHRSLRTADGGEDIAVKSLADTSVGRTVIGHMLTGDPDSGVIGLVEAVRRRRAEAILTLEKPGRGRIPDHFFVLADSDPVKLAALAAVTIMSRQTARPKEFGEVPSATLATAIGSNIRREYELEMWTEQSDDIRRLVGYHKGAIDKATFERWRRKFTDLPRLSQDAQFRSALCILGAELIEMAVLHGGGWIEQRVQIERGKTKAMVVLTDQARDYILMLHDKRAAGSVIYRPMVIPPRPWTRKGSA